MLLAASVPVGAEVPSIRRCIGSNGEPSFTDRPCTTAAPDTLGVMPAPSAAPITTQTCATSAAELRDKVQAAFSARNAMALSGLFLWENHSRGSATTQLQELAILVGEPLIGVDLVGATLDPAQSLAVAAQAMTEAPTTQTMTIRSGRGLDHVPHEALTEFAVLAQSGCWWLQLPR